jgi:aryl-alcohol dehydrogenase-like predicted oxidoreductase
MLGGSLTLADDLTFGRMGYGAMQLAGPHVYGPPASRNTAIAVLREAIELGVNHIDTSGFYGPFVVDEIIKEALHPYPEDLRIVTKVGARRPPDGSFRMERSRDDLILAVQENIENLGVEALDVVNLRIGGEDRPIEGEKLGEPFAVLAELREQGLIRHLGVSCVTPDQLSEAQEIAPVVIVQNLYNVARRHDDDLVDRCADEGIAYVPFFPLGGFTPLQSETLFGVAARLEVSTQQVALAWLLQRSPALALIPGTSSVEHLRDNVAAVSLELTPEALAGLDSIGADATAA